MAKRLLDRLGSDISANQVMGVLWRGRWGEKMMKLHFVACLIAFAVFFQAHEESPYLPHAHKTSGHSATATSVSHAASGASTLYANSGYTHITVYRHPGDAQAISHGGEASEILSRASVGSIISAVSHSTAAALRTGQLQAGPSSGGGTLHVHPPQASTRSVRSVRFKNEVEDEVGLEGGKQQLMQEWGIGSKASNMRRGHSLRSSASIAWSSDVGGPNLAPTQDWQPGDLWTSSLVASLVTSARSSATQLSKGAISEHGSHSLVRWVFNALAASNNVKSVVLPGLVGSLHSETSSLAFNKSIITTGTLGNWATGPREMLGSGVKIPAQLSGPLASGAPFYTHDEGAALAGQYEDDQVSLSSSHAVNNAIMYQYLTVLAMSLTGQTRALVNQLKVGRVGFLFFYPGVYSRVYSRALTLALTLILDLEFPDLSSLLPSASHSLLSTTWRSWWRGRRTSLLRTQCAVGSNCRNWVTPSGKFCGSA